MARDRSSVSAIAAKPTSNPFAGLIRTNPDRSSKRSGFFMPADVPRAGASGGQRTTTALWAPRAGNQFPDPGRLRRATEATARRRETDPPLSLRDDPDNGTCPAMPSAAGPGNGAAHRCAAPSDFLLGRLPTARIVTAGTSAPRNVEPQGVRRARGRSGG